MKVGTLVHLLDTEAAAPNMPRDRHLFDYQVLIDPDVGLSSKDAEVQTLAVNHDLRTVTLTTNSPTSMRSLV